MRSVAPRGSACPIHFSLSCCTPRSTGFRNRSRFLKTVEYTEAIRGKKLVLTGVVRDGDEVLYRFRARAGQRVTARVFGRDADFTVYLNYGLDAEAVARDTKSWSLTMPREFNGHCEIALHSTYKLADYRLEILLK